MSAPHKFLFDRSFDHAEVGRAALRQTPPPPPPEPTFSRAELDTARAQGVAEGREAALAEAMQSVDERAAAALSTFAVGVREMLETRQRYADDAQRQSLDAMRSIVQKIVPALCRKAPFTEIEALIADCLREAFDEPRIVLRVPDALFEPLQRRLHVITTSTGFAGKVVLLADETLGPGDARIEWADGGAERDTRRLLRDIDGALARALDALPAMPPLFPEENGNE